LGPENTFGGKTRRTVGVQAVRLVGWHIITNTHRPLPLSGKYWGWFGIGYRKDRSVQKLLQLNMYRALGRQWVRRGTVCYGKLSVEHANRFILKQ